MELRDLASPIAATPQGIRVKPARSHRKPLSNSGSCARPFQESTSSNQRLPNAVLSNIFLHSHFSVVSSGGPAPAKRGGAATAVFELKIRFASFSQPSYVSRRSRLSPVTMFE